MKLNDEVIDDLRMRMAAGEWDFTIDDGELTQAWSVGDRVLVSVIRGHDWPGIVVGVTGGDCYLVSVEGFGGRVRARGCQMRSACDI